MSNEYRTPGDTAGRNDAPATAVLFSAGLDSAVLVADALRQGPVQPVYVSVGFAWEGEERAAAARLFATPPFAGRVAPLAQLSFDMRDVFPPSHWAVRGEPPAFDTPDEDVFIDGRNVILLSKAGVFMSRHGLRRILIGTLAGNPFPDATPAFFEGMARALALGLGMECEVAAPFAALHKEAVIRMGAALGVRLDLTLSCMQPSRGEHCGRCSKCRERRDAFAEAGLADPTVYRHKPPR
jgi:7-cyano-7-deazaguanine synthase